MGRKVRGCGEGSGRLDYCVAWVGGGGGGGEGAGGVGEGDGISASE